MASKSIEEQNDLLVHAFINLVLSFDSHSIQQTPIDLSSNQFVHGQPPYVKEWLQASTLDTVMVDDQIFTKRYGTRWRHGEPTVVRSLNVRTAHLLLGILELMHYHHPLEFL